MKYYCPHCKSERVIEYGKYFQCVECNSEFSKESVGNIEDTNILSTQELDGFIDSFEELKDKKQRDGFLESLKEDFH
ncbi:MAG: hypothetical protein ACFFCE_01780 [Promethearchaeota archaeon]